MKEFSIVISDPHGIHARPAGKIAETAKKFTSRITLHHEEKTADAKRILALMSLGAVQGSRLKITVEGEDETSAAQTLKQTLEDLLCREEIQ